MGSQAQLGNINYPTIHPHCNYCDSLNAAPTVRGHILIGWVLIREVPRVHVPGSIRHNLLSKTGRNTTTTRRHTYTDLIDSSALIDTHTHVEANR